ncbi:MAG TPA: outer membrane protein assembly factor BamA [Deltaproteobacteria bacterium]|nr:outer membrane protein assembly factor BamA [Deltaproteobacteria bacterium]
MPNLFITAFICALLQFANAANASAEGEKIADVQIKGARRIAESTILNATALKPGDFLSGDKADSDLRSIYKLGHFTDVRVSTTQGPKGTVLIYSVTEKPIISSISFVGNKELKTDRLEKDGLEIKPKTVFSSKDLDRTVTKLKKLYGEKGYYLAEIKPVVENVSPTERAITFQITEGKKILIENITFEGNKSFSDSTFKGNRLLLKSGVMETKEAWFMSWLTDAGTYIEEALNNDALLIADHYMNHGYINVKVSEPTVKLNKDRDGLEVHFSITEGEQYRLGAIDFKGDLLLPASELKKKLKSETGAVFSRKNMRNDITTITDTYGDKGYAFANIVPLTKPDHDKKMVDVTFDIEKGELVYIERIAVSGNPKTRDKVIRREMRVTEGELFSATGMKNSKKNLMNTNYFEQANIATAKGSAANKLNVKVDVKEKPTGSFSIGGGYSSLDGIIGQASVSQGNFLGLGLKASISAAIGGKSQTYSVGLMDPYFMDTKWSLGVDIYRTERDYDDYSRRLTGGNIKTGYPLSDTVSTFFLYKYEIKDLYNPTSAYQADHNIEPDVYQLGTSTTSALLANISRNTTDYRMDPSTGMINNLSVEYAGLGGDNKYARFTTDHTWFTPLYKKLIFSTKLGFGYIQDVEGTKVPIDEKFYLGGMYALRGFKSRTVSPTKTSASSGGRVYLGGNKEFYGNAEMTFPLLSDAGIKMVTFFDYGNAYGENEKMFSSMYMSYGAGIRWASPLGPLRLEYGFPLNPRSGIDNRSGRLEFSIGSLF